MQRYNPKEIEPKWQQKWAVDKIHEASDDSAKPKRYILEYFPYPSGAAMHVGHVRNYTIGDALTRHARMNGYNVLHPMGWDAFGLPAENYAIKTGISPQEAIKQNTGKFKQQLTQMGFGYDWSREFASSDPGYYKWTQWFFLLLWRRGLAYQKESPQWWCPVDKTVLANEQVENGKCWRCGSEVEKKALKQWFFKITDYADRLANDLDDVDWSDSIKTMQRNWIGRKTGINITYKIVNTMTDESITCFTTRPDTNFGATFVVLAPEHPFVQRVMSQEVTPNDGASHWQAVEHYVQKAMAKSELERKEEGRLKTGAFTGFYVTNPLNDTKLPVWVSDFVLAGFGTGAVVGVPAHDERDFAFARQFDLPIKYVVAPEFTDQDTPPREGLEFVERVAAQAIVKHPSEEKYLLLRLKGWDSEVYSYPTGGIDDGEDPIETAKRELVEETGLHNIKNARQVGEPYYARFYHEFKKVNRRVKMYTVAIELQDLDQTTIDDKERELHELHWMTAGEVAQTVHGDGCKRMFQIYLSGDMGFAGEDSGVMINSGPLDGLDIHAATEKMMDLMEEKGMGKRTVSYSIRDWLISRQRYWGAPIPMIHCPACKEQIENSAHAINFRNEAIWKQILDGKKTIESRADNPEEADRRFADVKAGEYLKLVNKGNSDVRYARVIRALRFENLGELFVDKASLRAIAPGNAYKVLAELEQAYASLADGYVEKITRHGLIAWEFELVQPGIVPVPEDQLPVVLPEMKSYEPSGDGRSPLARVPEFVNVDCPKCGGPAQRETDTMDGFACSSWYFLRFADPHNSDKPFDDAKVKYWLPVDDYIGGAEHAVMHLLYARMWTKVMFDEGLINFNEPFKKLRNHGMILAPDGRKMSKSFGNVIAPDELIDQGYGADAIRIMELFIGPWNQTANWSVEGMGGSFRFLQRVWTLVQEFTAQSGQLGEQAFEERLLQITHRTIKKVSQDLESLSFNTAIAAMMEAVNEFYKIKDQDHFANAEAWRFALESLLQLLAPFAPHIADELWQQMGHEASIHVSEWPKYDERYLVSDRVTIVVQVNGKVRAQLEMPVDTDEAAVVEAAKASDKVRAHIDGKQIVKTVYVPGKILNLVVR